PSSLGINTAVRNFAFFSVFLVPNPAACPERCAIQRRCASPLRIGLQSFNQVSAQAAYQCWQAFWQRLQSAFPGLSTWKVTVFAQHLAQALADGILLFQESQQQTGTVQTANNHDD